MSEGKRIEALLSGEEMGDKKPSEFYRKLKTLAGQSTIVTESLILELWKRRLPTLVQVSIKASSKSKIEELLEVADDIYEVYQQQNTSTFSIANNSNKTISELTCLNQNLQTEIGEIKSMLSNLKFNNSRSRNPSRSHSSTKPFRNRSRSRNNNSAKVCWYHAHWGNKAQRCSKPCSFNNNNPN